MTDDMMEYMGVHYVTDDELYEAIEKARPIMRAKIIAYVHEVLEGWNDKQIAHLMGEVNRINPTDFSEELFQEIDPNLFEQSRED